MVKESCHQYDFIVFSHAAITQILKNFQRATGKAHLWPHLMNTNDGGGGVRVNHLPVMVEMYY